jgi:bacteriocin-like protein
MTNLNNNTRELSIDELSNVSGGDLLSGSQQMSMMNLHSVASEWSTMVQLTTNTMNSTDNGMNGVIGKIKG